MKSRRSLLVVAVALSISAPALAQEEDEAGEAAAVVKAATGIENREPTGESSQFKTGDRIFVWSQIKNASGQSIEHVWKRDGKELRRARFTMGSSSWRVNSRISNAAPGNYLVEVTSGEDVLGSTRFTVE